MLSVTGHFLAVTTIFIPLLFVLYNYLRILLVCRKSSSEFRGKALQTCLPHIVTFVNYCISLFCEVSLSLYKEVNPFVIVVLSLEFLIIPPITNPLVYGLKLPQIRGAISGTLLISKIIKSIAIKLQLPRQLIIHPTFHLSHIKLVILSSFVTLATNCLLQCWDLHLYNPFHWLCPLK
ncbi:hypothetical protein Q8A73_009529 [Channa argus]|nr:hypothetical protein Q8A73_009529 [Channa argus]